MINYRIANLEWEVDSSLDIDKENIGELIYELKEALPEFSSSAAGDYIFRNTNTKNSLISNGKSFIIRSEGLFEESYLFEILSIVTKYLSEKEHSLRMRIKQYLTNEEGRTIEMKPALNELFGSTFSFSKLRSVGFEIEGNDKSMYYSLQTRRDNLEALILTSVVYYQSQSLNDIYKYTLENIDQIKEYLENSSPLSF